MLNTAMKENSMTKLAVYREGLKKMPQIRNLFLELTLRCNERCLHCGSSCGDVQCSELPPEVWHRVMDEVKQDLGTDHKMICVTGGEPLLRTDFFEIMDYARQLGFSWGMTSNGTLITPDTAKMLKKAGMRTISVSIDGLADTHDAFRRTKGGWERAMQGVQNLIDEGGFKEIQITTVVTHQNINELDKLYKIMDKMDIDSWRIINIEPMGRAKQHPELLLTDDDYRYMFEYIRNMRMNGEPVCYGCSHYLGDEYEREVRDWYFLCTAGIYTASITADGDIIACLDIERRPEFVQGNVLHDRFTDVWKNKFGIFRRDLADTNEKCSVCPDKDRCHGDSYHSWDFDNNQPLLCLKDILAQ